MSEHIAPFRPGSILDPIWWHDALHWFGNRATAHIKRFWWAWAAAIAIVATFNYFCALGVNAWTESLPQKTFLILKQSKTVARDDYIAFKWQGGPPYPRGLTFVKMVKGVPGDVVTREGRDYYINGAKVATAKEFSLKGEPLELGPTGIIPAGRYFVWTPHKDSLDSRYGRAGWISQDDVLGRVKPLL